MKIRCIVSTLTSGYDFIIIIIKRLCYKKKNRKYNKIEINVQKKRKNVGKSGEIDEAPRSCY